MEYIQMLLLKNNRVFISTLIRVLVALFGGFIFANLAAILITYLSAGNAVNVAVDDIVTGLMVSFLVYAAVVIFVFSTKSALSATLYVTSSCLVSFAVVSYIDRAIQ